MRSTKLVPLLALGLLLFAGCRDQPMPTAPDDVALTVSEDRFGGAPPFRARLVSRTMLAEDIVHYSWELPVGSGPFETVRLHRLVRESLRPPYRPVPKMEGVMLLPGAPQLFETIFLPPPTGSVPLEESSVALYLASNDVDVWGMTYGWAYIPYGHTDFEFLKGWGIAKDAKHTEMALTLARWMRSTSGQGAGPIHVMGFSYGGFLVYAVAGEDTQRRGNLKNVKGIIPVDGTTFKPATATSKATGCKALPGIVADIEAGSRYLASGGWMYGEAALYAPNEVSTLLPPYTNYQAAQVLLVMGGFVRGSYSPGPPSTVTLFHTDPQRVVDALARPFIMGHPPYPYYPYQWNYDVYASWCEDPAYPVSFDDHLGDITVPILYINQGAIGAYATTLTSSTDITQVVLNPTGTPSEQRYGHADLFWARDAADRVWRHILEWIRAHE
jgi:hypothetical protein